VFYVPVNIHISHFPQLLFCPLTEIYGCSPEKQMPVITHVRMSALEQGEAKALEISNSQGKFRQASRDCTSDSGLLMTRLFPSRRHQLKREISVRPRICLCPFSRYHFLVVLAMFKIKLKR